MISVPLAEKCRASTAISKRMLAVSPLILVSKTACDLEIPIVSTDHQQLLELLWTLWQSIKLAGMYATGHQVISSPLWRALEQNRRLDLEETAGVKKIPNELDGLVANDYVALHSLASQIQITVPQAQRFIH